LESNFIGVMAFATTGNRRLILIAIGTGFARRNSGASVRYA
jgi:hypothetical protein